MAMHAYFQWSGNGVGRCAEALQFLSAWNAKCNECAVIVSTFSAGTVTGALWVAVASTVVGCSELVLCEARWKTLMDWRIGKCPI